ncbi:transcriptional regulator [Halorarum salinum]|uniref:Transcriptional regulator n=1 Tax=Halorarum salinum TaxID=2743089 RepID=A0A7D5QLG1_9EURY|nr:transcriptional regulator [Halobaculum salinum]QLG62785.1 transcriptional regulator [Halobaculum salinum]
MTLYEYNRRDIEEFTAPRFNTEEKDWELFKAELNRKHLPRLKRAGIISWDRDSDTITRGPKFEDVRPLIRLIDDHPDELPEDWSYPEID